MVGMAAFGIRTRFHKLATRVHRAIPSKLADAHCLPNDFAQPSPAKHC